MKKLTLFFGLALFGISAKAQYNYAEWGFGGGASLVRPYSDLKQNDNSFSVNGDIYYNYSPYVTFAFEGQLGKLSGGNDLTDESHRFFKSKYVSLSMHGDLQLGEIVDFENSYVLQRLKGFYLGSGIGFTFNNIYAIRRYALDVPDYRFPGVDKSVNLLVPLRFGYEFKIFNEYDEPFMSVNIGYVHNLTFSEGMDGYDDPPTKFKNNAQDMFRQITVGVKFNFGNSVSYNKAIH